MATKTINFNKIGILANTPLIKLDDGTLYPLYPRIRNDETKFTDIELNPKYIAASNRGPIGSPTNIRRVFITRLGTYVVTYLDNNGKNSRGGRVHRNLMTDAIPELKHGSVVTPDGSSIYGLKAALYRIMSYKSDYEAYIMQKSYDKNAKEPDRFVISGSGMGFASNPYVMSNIEEIYFDWSMLLPEDNIAYFGGEGNIYNYAYNILNGCKGLAAPFSTDSITACFRDKNMAGTSDLRKRFPRLKVIAFVPDIESLVESNSYEIVKLGLPKRDSDKCTMWLAVKEVQEAVQQLGNAPVICDLRADAKDELVTKTSTFIYDRDIASSAFDEIRKSKIVNSSDDSTVPDVEHEAGLSEMGLIISDLMESGADEAFINYLLKLSGQSFSPSEKETIIRHAPEDCRSKVKKALSV